MPRSRKGVLQYRYRASGWFARLTVDVEGEAIRKWFDLQTQNEVVARRKMQRLVKEHAVGKPLEDLAADAKLLETYAEAAAWIRARRRGEGYRNVHNEESRDRLYMEPVIGRSDVSKIRVAEIEAVLARVSNRGDGAGRRLNDAPPVRRTGRAGRSRCRQQRRRFTWSPWLPLECGGMAGIVRARRPARAACARRRVGRRSARRWVGPRSSSRAVATSRGCRWRC